jgi:hypothetical protein
MRELSLSRLAFWSKTLTRLQHRRIKGGASCNNYFATAVAG